MSMLLAACWWMRAKQIASRKKMADLCLANNDGKGRKSETGRGPGAKAKPRVPETEQKQLGDQAHFLFVCHGGGGSLGPFVVVGSDVRVPPHGRSGACVFIL